MRHKLQFGAHVGIVAAAWIAGCSSDQQTYERCPEGQIATVSGCLPIPARTFDAGLARDALAPADNGETVSPPQPDAGGDPDPMDSGVPNPDEPVELAGDWAMEITDVQTITSPTLGITDSVTITTIARLLLGEAPGSLVITTEICDLSSTRFSSYSTTYPAATIRSIPLDEGFAEVSGRTIGASFVSAARVELMGWRAALDPMTAELPQSPNDPRLIDGDEDRNPGVTLNISGPISGDIYVATRAIVNLEGTVAGADRIEGLVKSTRARSLLGASNQLLAAGDATFEQDPDPMASTFRIVRLPPMVGPTCEAIVAAKALLFPPPP